ncbi:class I SAM-dependent methyltransferase [Candidatus Roizmanbacteria bacterium]|nr:class I SAM-dependent methyltransferase [Candidatus Roizmanbacteria bacterium]
MKEDSVQRQREYYAKTAQSYDDSHINSREPEHDFALSVLTGILDYYQIESILDVGSGTGRVITHFIKVKPELSVMGVEPVQALREVAYKKGISSDILIQGDATQLGFPDKKFDLVCAFGVLHHIQDQKKAISEMFRVGKKAVFISDSNIYVGTNLTGYFKRFLKTLGLWDAAYKARTFGKGYNESEGDGITYPYSVLDSYSQFRSHCKEVHLFNTRGDSNTNFYKTASHIAMLGIK